MTNPMICLIQGQVHVKRVRDRFGSLFNFEGPLGRKQT